MTAVRLSAFFFALFAQAGAFVSYFGLFLAARGFSAAEIAFAVADEHQSRGVGSILANELAADARAAGITQLVATVCGDNPRVMALLKRLGSLSLTWRGGERELVIGLEH